MTGECNVARDLMPLCIDGAASKESEAYVEAHVSECEACRAYYDGMRARLPESVRRQAEAEGEAFAQTAARMRRRRKIRRTILCALAVTLVAALAVGVIGVYRMDYTMPASWYDVTVSQLEDGGVVVTFRTNRKIETGGIGGGMGPYYLNSGASRFEATCWLIDWHAFRLDHRTDHYSVIATRKNDAEMESIDCIGCGSGQGVENMSIVWRRGDEAAPASPEMEAYFAALDEHHRYYAEIREKHMREQIENGDYFGSFYMTGEEYARLEALMQVCDELKKAVPEWGAGESDVELMGVVA